MKLVFPRLYAIIDAVLLAIPEATHREELVIAEMLAQSGVKLIQYRNKRATSRGLFNSAQALARLLAPRGVKFIVNDRADVAALAGADGVHVGQEDLGVEQARAICGASCWVGVSTHTLEQVERAATTSADYIAVGPIFFTATKENPDPVVGLDFIRQARRLTAKPLVAIGGITLDRAAEVYAAGADSLAVARDLIAAPDPVARAREFLAIGERFGARATGIC